MVEKKAGAAPPLSPPKTLAQAEKGAAETKEPSLKAQENLKFGAGIANLGVSMMLAWYFLPQEARGAHNQWYIIPILFGFISFISGVCLMLLSMNLLELPEHLVSQTKRMVYKHLPSLCSTWLAVTVVSPLVLSEYTLYRYIVLALLFVVTAPLAVARWYVGLKADGGDEEAAYREHKEQLEAAFKHMLAIITCSFGGLFALVVNYDVTGGSGQTKSAVLVAIFLMSTTSIFGLFFMQVRAKVLEFKSQRLRGCFIQCMWLANIFMHLLLAFGVLAVGFAIVEFAIFAAFAPWVFAAAVYIFLEHRVGRARAAQDNDASEYQEVRLTWKAERGIKITMWSFTAIITIFGGFLHGKIESLKACIILLTSAFMTAFPLTVVTIKPDSTSVGLAAATTVLDWTASATFAAAIFAVIIAMVSRSSSLLRDALCTPCPCTRTKGR